MSTKNRTSPFRSATFEGLEARELFSLATEASAAYTYGVAPVLANITEQIATNVANPNPTAAQAPINQFANSPAYPAAGSGVFVRPSADLLYSTAWLDLSKGPLVFKTPDSNGAYKIFQFLDAYTNTFTSVGTRTTGDGATNFLIAGPNWNGQVPQGLTLIKAPTNTVWIVGRLAVQNDANGNPIYGPVNALQAQLSLIPLANYTPSATYTPPTNVPVTPLSPDLSVSLTANQNLTHQTAQDYYTLLSNVLKLNPPPAADSVLLRELADFNLAPGQHFNWNTLTADQKTALSGSHAFAAAPSDIALDAAESSEIAPAATITSHWNETLADTSIATFGTNYSARAAVASSGLGANLVEDAVYPSTSVDSTGTALNGANNYVIHFAAGQLPPASAFWSVTVYDSTGYFIANPINRFSTGSLHNELKYNSDGSLDLYLQSSDPGGSLTSNWLPTVTTANYGLVLRIYDPQAPVYSKAWVAPDPVKVVAPTIGGTTLAPNTAARSVFADGTPVTNAGLLDDLQTSVLEI